MDVDVQQLGQIIAARLLLYNRFIQEKPMSDFLHFLNTADLQTLTQVPGVSRQLAGNLIAARPFDAAEDCLNVKGMGKATLARLESFASAQKNESENSAMIPVENEAAPAPVEKIPPAQDSARGQDSFLQRFGRAFRFFLKALAQLIMLAALVAGFALLLSRGLPYIQETFIAPVEANTAQIQKMEAEIADLQAQLTRMDAQVAALESSREAHTDAITRLEEMQETLDARLAEKNDAVLLKLKHEVMLTRALDMLARGRLYLAQSNYGLAKADVQTARDLLAELNAEKDDAILSSAIERLDMSLGNLPEFPVVASGDLEIAWQILISGNAPALTATATPTPAPLESATPTPVVDLSATPTPLPPPTSISPTVMP